MFHFHKCNAGVNPQTEQMVHFSRVFNCHVYNTSHRNSGWCGMEKKQKNVFPSVSQRLIMKEIGWSYNCCDRWRKGQKFGNSWKPRSLQHGVDFAGMEWISQQKRNGCYACVKWFIQASIENLKISEVLLLGLLVTQEPKRENWVKCNILLLLISSTRM